jgi:hypothetical protein
MKIVRQRFGAEALPIGARSGVMLKRASLPKRLTPAATHASETRRLQAAIAYVERNRARRWAKELTTVAPGHC